jgi:enoyl-CoA hydratase/carnithine racemase/3-hydroxyacyl-CoA dehydrogenase
MVKTMENQPAVKAMRQPTLRTLGLGDTMDIFRRGGLPADASALVDSVFGPANERGSMVISGASGIVGAGKTMQFASRLQPHGVRLVALDFPGAPDGIGQQYAGLVGSFGKAAAEKVMGGIVRLTYDGRTLPPELGALRPRFLLEAVPEILDIKRAHYAVFRDSFPDLEIRSVTSGFPSSELGVGIAHPAFPHEINKVFEIVEDEPSDITKLLWSLGLIPLPVGDQWSFILDVLFCGVTLAGLRYHRTTNMPYWKIDKLTRKLIGPNPFRAHDAIGAKGADFLTWSCLHHLAETYGELFRPTPELVERKDTGQDWYPPNHFRPLVDWKLTDTEAHEFRTWMLGPLFQMTSLMLHEGRGHLTHLNAIGELCAQFRRGILAEMRGVGADEIVATVEAYHRLYPPAAGGAWFPETLEAMDSPEWTQLYVNAEHDGDVGVVTLSRESYNWDVDRELNRALDWLRAEGIERIIVTSDFHISTQMVGADTSEFYPALNSVEEGLAITTGWSRTARRLYDDFPVSVALVPGKRCLGGMLELLMHCHFVVAVDGARLGWPEVTIPVVPGMEACHWPMRRAGRDDWPKLLQLLLNGSPVVAADAVGWLIDHAAPLEEAIQTAWSVARTGHGLVERPLEESPLEDIPTGVVGLVEADGPAMEAARKAILDCVRDACGASSADAVGISAKRAADFLAGPVCRGGAVGAEYSKTMMV